MGVSGKITKNRTPRKSIRLSRTKLMKAAALVHGPKSSLLIVVLFLFVVVMNWAVQRSAWLPLSQADSVPFEATEMAETQPAPSTEEVLESAEDEDEEDGTDEWAAERADRTGWDFFHPSWSETPQLDRSGIPEHHPNLWTISDAKLSRIVGDPFRRLGPEFQVSQDLRERVLFWMRIHTQYSSYMRVLHDRNNPSIVYGIADFSALFNESSTDKNALNNVYRFERQIQKELKARLAEAAGLTNTRNLSPWEHGQIRALLSRAGALGKAEAASAIGSIRSQTGQRDEFMMALTRSEDLLPYIEATFRSYDLPVELARIPFVESSFNPRAYSKVGATGIFQFMPFTARQMISSDPALWSDPLRQTRAAARMLTIFRSMLPDWSTTVTAYNSGVGRLSRLSRKYHAKSIGPLLDRHDPTGLGFAGKNFYAQFLSANLGEAYRREIFPLRKRDEEDLQIAFERPRTFARRFHSLY